MKPKTKAILRFAGVLALGMLLGALLLGAFTTHRVTRFRSVATEEGMIRAVERIVRPEDQAQRAAIREIVRRHSDEARRIRATFRQDLRTLVHDVRDDLVPILRPDQVERVDRAVLRFERWTAPPPATSSKGDQVLQPRAGPSGER